MGSDGDGARDHATRECPRFPDALRQPLDRERYEPQARDVGSQNSQEAAPETTQAEEDTMKPSDERAGLVVVFAGSNWLTRGRSGNLLREHRLTSGQ